jgi:hypothetical protein
MLALFAAKPEAKDWEWRREGERSDTRMPT